MEIDRLAPSPMRPKKKPLCCGGELDRLQKYLGGLQEQCAPARWW